jgi:hypothetical protein
MRLPTEAEFLQGAAIVVAAPRYMGTFASAIGIDVLAYWPAFAKIEIGSGAAMAILEGWAVAFMFRKWRVMQPGSAHWWVLLTLQILLMIALPITAAPYLASSQLGEPVANLLNPALWWLWILTVAAIAPLVLAAVGYADVESKPATPEQKPAIKVQKPPVVIEQKEQIISLQKPILLSKVSAKKQGEGAFACPDCSSTFAKVQGLNAHKRHCTGIIPVDLPMSTGGSNGKH